MGHPALKQPPPKLSVEEFLDWDDGTDTRYELIEGEVVAMNPPLPTHSKIAGRIATVIGPVLRHPCDLYTEAALRPRNLTDSFFKADLAVSCTEEESADRSVPEPIIIIEVLSPSTMNHDRGTKLPAYRSLPSVKEIALISQVSVHVELWHRTAEGWAVADLMNLDDVLRFSSIGAEVSLATLYLGIRFGVETPAESPAA